MSERAEWKSEVAVGVHPEGRDTDAGPANPHAVEALRTIPRSTARDPIGHDSEALR